MAQTFYGRMNQELIHGEDFQIRVITAGASGRARVADDREQGRIADLGKRPWLPLCSLKMKQHTMEDGWLPSTG